MACQLWTVMRQPCCMKMENEFVERSYMSDPTFSVCHSYRNLSFVSRNTRICAFCSNNVDSKSAPFAQRSLFWKFESKKHEWRLAFALDTGGLAGNDEQESANDDDDGSNLGRTRLGRIVSAGGRRLLEKLKSARKNFPMKVFLVLLGFYTANALATILGQTGDWDVLVAGIVVAAIEGIGMLMYRKSGSRSSRRFQDFVVMVNYWKAGVCLGLFVDAFKLGS